MHRCLALLAFVLGLTGTAVAQGVIVAPHAVYVDHRTRSASITLYNPGTEPAEVTVSSFFGYPVTDSLGQFALFTPDSVTADMPSAAGWIEAFPKRMTIAPLQRQTVRLLARPPQGLPDGEYWSRLVVSAKGGSLPVTAADSAAGISVGLALEVRSIFPLLYRKGKQGTGVALSALRAAPAGDSIAVRMKLARQGTAAYTGTARGTLVAPNGEVVGGFERPIAVYTEAEPAFALPMPAQASGTYRLRVELTTERSDIAPELLLRTPPVVDSVEVRLP
ncbi:MAG TPA: hypothetical protein VFX50_12050 [Gemmatimonadales bacterium]|nr:hypothetical protein [Gemmatimonadales bacterium]